MKVLITSILLNIYFIGYSNNLDSLQQLSSSSLKQDIQKVNSLNEIAFSIFNTKTDSSLKLAHQAQIIAQNINFKNGEAESNYIMGLAYLYSSQYRNGLNSLQKSLSIFDSLHSEVGQSKCLNAIGMLYTSQNKYDLAIETHRKTLTINRRIGDDGNVGTSLSNIANIYIAKGEYKKALPLYKKALKIKQILNDIRGESICLNNLGIVYANIGDASSALENYNKSLLIEEVSGNEIGVANRLSNISNIHRSRGQLEKSLEYSNRAIKIYEKYNKNAQIAQLAANIGNIYNEQEKIEDAEKMYQKSLEISESIDFKKQIGTTLNNLGMLEIRKENFDLALTYYQEALDINTTLENKKAICVSYLGLANVYNSTRMNDLSLENALEAEKIAKELNLVYVQNKIYKLLSGIYYNTKQYKNAFEKQIEHKMLNDSIFSKKSFQEMSEIEYEYKYKQTLDSANYREQKLTKKVKTAYQDVEKSEKQKLLAIIFALIITMLLGTTVFILRLKNINSLKQNILVEQKLLRSQMTPHFIFNSLTVLQGIILNKEYKKSITYLSRFSKLLRITLENSRDKMVLLDKELEAVENYLILQNLRTETPYRYDISIDKSINTQELLIPPMMIQPFVENAIEHAFREGEENREIDITLTYVNEILTCKIKDNGIGISSYKKRDTKAKKSLATTITMERLKVFAKEFNIKANMHIVDRKEQDQKGTLVTLTLPYKII